MGRPSGLTTVSGLSAGNRARTPAPRAVSPGFPERDHALEVACLGEQVKKLHGGQHKSGVEEVAQVAHLGGRIARDIHHGARAEGKQLSQERFIAAFARRIDHNNGVRRLEIDPGKDCGGVASEKRGVRNSVGRGVFPGEGHGGFADLDAGDPLEPRRRRKGEQPAAAIRVDEKARTAGRRLIPNVSGEGRQDEGVVLEEIARQEFQAQGAGAAVEAGAVPP